VRSRRKCPTDALNRHSSSAPVPRTSPEVSSPCTCEPAGSAIRTSTDLVFLEKLRAGDRGPRTVNVPSAYSTRVCWAARTSDSSDSLLGCTSTAVSVRSLATICTLPAWTSIVTEIGSGVAKTGMAVPQEWVG